MSTKDNNRELGINDMAFTIEVESEVIEGVRHGKITHITLQRESWGHT